MKRTLISSRCIEHRGDLLCPQALTSLKTTCVCLSLFFNSIDYMIIDMGKWDAKFVLLICCWFMKKGFEEDSVLIIQQCEKIEITINSNLSVSSCLTSFGYSPAPYSIFSFSRISRDCLSPGRSTPKYTRLGRIVRGFLYYSR